MVVKGLRNSHHCDFYFLLFKHDLFLGFNLPWDVDINGNHCLLGNRCVGSPFSTIEAQKI